MVGCAVLCYTQGIVSGGFGEARMPVQAVDSAEQRAFLTPQEVSDLLRVSVYTVRRWIKTGKLPAYKVGRSWRIQESDLNTWLRQKRLDAVADDGA